MRLLTAAQMRAVDNQVVTETGIPSIVLMENAGRQVAEVAATFLEEPGTEDSDFRQGNNAGDGLWLPLPEQFRLQSAAVSLCRAERACP